MDNSQELRVLSLFSGYGGIEKGIRRAGHKVNVLAHCEIESYSIANMVSKMETGKMDPTPIWTDVKTLPLHIFRNKVDVITGGFPCQPFSSAGHQRADADPRHLFPYVLKAAQEIRPKYIFLENVAGLLSAKLGGDGWSDPKGTPVLLHVLRELERVGYRAEAGIFSAEEVGAPHQRKRVFILAELLDEYINESSTQEDSEESGKSQLENTNSDDDRRISGEFYGKKIEEWVSEWHDNSKSSNASEVTQWPARPNEQQYSWEQPRVITNPKNVGGEDSLANSLHSGLQGSLPTGETHSIKRVQPIGETGGLSVVQQADSTIKDRRREEQDVETESKLGRVTDGTALQLESNRNRVDRLRMCGNGVVPQTAEIAWKTLMTRFFANPQ